MEKFVHEPKVLRKRGTNIPCKSLKKEQFIELQEFCVASIQGAKTMKITNKKPQKIPFLQMAYLRSMQRKKFLSSDNKKMQRLRDESSVCQSKVCFYDYELRNFTKSPREKCQAQSEICRRSCIFPPIDQQKQSLHSNLEKHQQILQNTIELPKKKLRQNIHCKVLLARNSNFPFIGNGGYDHKKADSLKSKSTYNTQRDSENLQPFELDISCINEVQEPPTPGIASFINFQQNSLP